MSISPVLTQPVSVTFAPKVAERLEALTLDTNILIGTHRRLARQWRKEAAEAAARGHFADAATRRAFAQDCDRRAGEALAWRRDWDQRMANITARMEASDKRHAAYRAASEKRRQAWLAAH